MRNHYLLLPMLLKERALPEKTRLGQSWFFKHVGWLPVLLRRSICIKACARDRIEANEPFSEKQIGLVKGCRDASDR